MIKNFGKSSTGRTVFTRTGQTFSTTHLRNGTPTRALMFLRFVAQCQLDGRLATRKEFLTFMGKPVRPGYWSDFFAGIIRTGAIVKTRRGKVTVYVLPTFK